MGTVDRLRKLAIQAGEITSIAKQKAAVLSHQQPPATGVIKAQIIRQHKMIVSNSSS